MSQVIVAEPHKATYAHATQMRAGETLEVGPEDVDFPGWVWCTATTGVSGWVPKAYLQIDGTFGQLTRDYHAGELTVTVGQRLTVVEEESGWYLCDTETGERGWVPIENVRPL